jgi:DNA-binding NarL/FixJ family response regulator
VHAERAAERRDLREALRHAVRARDRARSAAIRRSDDGAAVDMWQALVSGRWSLIDRFESDGRRFTVAIENEPRVADPRALSPRERCVVQLAARGHANKSIAYSLGLAAGTVGALLARALRKLGLGSRAELAYWATICQAGENRTIDLEMGPARLAVTSAVAATSARALGLTARDETVVRAVANGASNDQIARALGCSPRTVANRMARLFVKLDVGSRAELAQWFARAGTHELEQKAGTPV